MSIENAEVAALFEQLADLLEIEGANPFRVRAYRNAARSLRPLARRVADLVEAREDLSKLPGIGKDLAEKIDEIVRTGRLGLLEEVGGRTSPGLTELLRIPGLGPKRARVLHQELGIDSLDALARAARGGEIRELPGFGARTETALLAALESGGEEARRLRWIEAERVAASVVRQLRSIVGVERVTVAGSFRRKCETVGDLDVLVACRRGTRVTDRFVEHPDVREVVSHGETRATVRLRSGLQVDLRVVPPVSYGAALHYFTGSKTHNIAVRKLGMERKLKINEYGVFRGSRRIAGRTEDEVYGRVGLPFVEPELREDRGEIQAAAHGHLPRLVRERDVRGDLHCHTRDSDGRASLRDMVEAARQRGYAYLAIADHSQSLRVARGLDALRRARQLERIDRLNRELEGFVVLKSAEVEIREDGSLDLPRELLAELDLTVCAIHSHLDLSAERQTERILRAMDDPHFHVLAHPSGRLLGRRPACALDLERVIAGAAQRGCYLEVNGQPERLDLTDVACRTAKEMGVPVVISSDAHSVEQLDFVRLGVGQARRGWLEADDVLNTRSWPQLRARLRRG